VVAERSGRLRFETLSPFEQPLSTLVSDGKQFALYDLAKKRYYHGPATPQNISRLLPIRMRGQDIAQLLMGEPPLIAPAPSGFAVDRCKSAYELTYLLPASKAQQTVSFDAERLVPVRTRLTVDGKLAWEITFEDHREVSGARIPHKIRYVAPADQVDLLVLYTDVTLNETFEPDLFVIPPPRGVEIIPLD
jgi:outer membrane lipoprotein-sorting protein